MRIKSPPHRLCAGLRDVRLATGLSINRVCELHPNWSPVVLGSYERGDRMPSVAKIDAAYGLYGFELAPRPIGTQKLFLPDDMVSTLRAIANQLEARDDLQRLLPATT